MSFIEMEMQYGGSCLNYPETMVSPGMDNYIQYSPEYSHIYPSQQTGYDPPMSTEVFGPPSISQGDSSPTEDYLRRKKALRRIKNREAALRCRRKKLEKIEVLRNSLHKLYARSMDLQKQIAAVEADVMSLKSCDLTGITERGPDDDGSLFYQSRTTGDVTTKTPSLQMSGTAM